MNFNTKYLWGLIPLALAGFLFYYFADIVIYIILAWVVSMIGAPIMRFFKRFFNKNIAAIFTLISFIIFLVLMIWVFIPPLTTQAKNLSSVNYEQLADRLEEPIDKWKTWLEDKGLMMAQESKPIVEESVQKKDESVITHWIDVDSIRRSRGDTLLTDSPPIAVLIHLDNQKENDLNDDAPFLDENNSFFDQIRMSALSFLNPSNVQNFFGSILGFFGNMLIAIMSILFISFFFLREQGLFDNMIASLVPMEYEGQSLKAINESSALLIRYFIGIVVQIATITIFVSVSLKVLGVNNALLIGFFAALMNVIPYVGPLFGAGFGMLITISSNLELPFYGGISPILLKVLIVIAIMQLLDNFILQPTIFGKSVKAHPLEIFLVILIAAKIGGILGMVIAIPSYTVIRVIGKVFFSEFKIVQRITQNL